MEAGMYFKIGADFSKLEKLKRDISELKTQLKGMDQAATPKEFKKLERQLHQLTTEFSSEAQAAAIAAKETEKVERLARGATSDFDRFKNTIFKVDEKTFLTNLGKEMIDVRSKYQQLEITFTTMLKSGEKASSLMNNLTKFAAETPFGLDSAATGAKQLMAYGSQAENIIDELGMLGNVAIGTGQPLNDLVDLYGRLRTQDKASMMDIQQFAGRGIPIYEEIAKVMKIDTNEVNKFASAGKIGFKEVEQAFQNMTSNSGMYGGLMEEQSKSILGRIEQLNDNIENLFNEVGKSSEGVIYSIIDTASGAVAHYQEIGEALAALIAVYGTYKTVVIATNAIQQTVEKVKYNDQSKALEEIISKERNLITEEQKLALSKNGLIKGSREYSEALRQEIEVAMSNSTRRQQGLQNELTSTRTQIKSREQSIEALRREIIERETSVKGLKLMTEAEINADKSSMTAKQKKATLLKIENAEKKINTSYTKLNTLELEKNSLKRIENSTAAKLNSEGMRANSLQTQYNTAIQNSNTASTDFLTVAKKRLTTVAKNLWAAISPNPYALAAAAVVALGYSIYKLTTSTTEAQKSINSFNEEAAKQSIELNGVFNAYKKANEGTEEKKKLLDVLKSKYGEYIGDLIDEKGRIDDIEEAQRRASKALKESIALKIKNESITEVTAKEVKKQASSLGELRGIIAKRDGDEAANIMISKIGEIFSDETKSLRDAAMEARDYLRNNDFTFDSTKGGIGAITLDRILNDLQGSAWELRKEKKNIEDSFRGLIQDGSDKTVLDIYTPSDYGKEFDNYSKLVTDATDKVSRLKQELSGLRSDESKVEKGKLTKAIEDKAKELEEAEKNLASLTGSDKKTISTENSAIKQAKDRKKLTDKQSLEASRAAEDLEIQFKEADIKTKDEGSEKAFAQLKLNYEKEKLALKRQQEAALKTKIEYERTLFEADANNKGKTFDDTAIQLSEEELNKYRALQEKNDEIYLNDKTSLELQYMRDYIKEYGTYQQKKMAIAQEYDKKIAASGNEYDRKSLENQKQAAVSAVDFEALNKRIDWQGVFGNLTGMLESQLKEARKGLKEYVKTDQFKTSSETDKKTVYDAIENLRKVIPGGEGTLNFNAIRQQMNDLAVAFEQVQSASISEKLANDNLAKAQKKYEEALKTGNQSIKDQAKQNLDIANFAATVASNAYKDAETNVQNLGNNLRETTTDTVDGLNLVADGFKDIASNSLPQLLKGLQNTLSGLSKLNISGGVDETVGTLSETLSSDGFIGSLISAVLSIIDVLKDGIGTLVSNLIDTVLNAVDGILKDILSGDFVVKIGNSLKDGIGNILNTISFGGFNSLVGSINGSNAKETAETISRLTISNEALKVSVDSLKDEMSGSNGSKSIQAYNEAVEAQKRYNENLRNILGAQMDYHGSHHSNAYYWDLNPKSLNEVNKLLGTNLNNTWGDFSELTADQMNEIRKHLPDVWSEMLSQGKYADRFKNDWNNYADQAGKVEELTKNSRENIAQISFDSLRDSFVDTLMDMDSDAQDFAGDFEEYLTKALLNFAIGNMLDTELKKWYNSWTDTMNKQNGELTKEQKDQYKKQWDDMVQRGLDKRDEIASFTGYTGKDSSSQQATRGVYEGMSQDTGERLEARNTAIHMTTERMDSNLLTISTDVRNISDQMVYVSEAVNQGIASMEEVRTIQLNSYYELKDINNNTKELYQMNERLGQMNDKLSRL